MKRIDDVAHEPELPFEMSMVHPVFYVSMLRKCLGDPSSIVPLDMVNVEEPTSRKCYMGSGSRHEETLFLSFSNLFKPKE